MGSNHFEEPINYYDRRFKKDAIKILPGQYCVTSQDKILVTVLGSCVAACMFDPKLGIGGMNHFMLPDAREVLTEDNSDFMATKYGVHAMEMLINDLVKAGADKKRIKAKVFGGGKVVPSIVQQNIGEINAKFVMEFLDTENIPTLASDLCNSYARKIYFFPLTGDVLMKRIHKLNNATIIERESIHRRELSERSISGSVDLFEE
ncbi:chemoreceptor glutamine deamidase CheD [Alteromonas sp. D210916BOD_24]|uniref:chemoreceptor glutamine deamidase CheD n=1 Tax=Alteromonas sp. D210916BOD_24 TaxID=3157618 RepID=UPI00399C7466